MAEQERLTKKERRERARAERKAKEAEQAKRAKRQRLTSILVGVLIVGLVAAVIVTAIGRDEGLDEAIVLSTSEAEEARAAAGCQPQPTSMDVEATHFEANAAPPANQLYGTSMRPAATGPHFNGTHPVISHSDSQLEERALLHNMEHGAVVVWYDPEQVADPDPIADWARSLNDAGFDTNGGAAIFSSVYTDPGITSGKAVAFRGWGVALDCDEWNETVANSFLIDNYGTHGVAPERPFAPYPEEVLRYSDAPAEDDTEAPTEDAGGETESPTETEAPTETESPAATETPTDSES